MSAKNLISGLSPYSGFDEGEIDAASFQVHARLRTNQFHWFPYDTKNDLVTRISSVSGLKQDAVFGVVQKTLDHIAETLAKGDRVELRDFGIFEVKVRKAKVGQNPNIPGLAVPIPPRAIVKFKAGKALHKEVLKLTPKA